MTIKSVNPTTGATIREYSETSPAEVARIVERAHAAFAGWRRTGFPERAASMREAARLLREGKERYARLMAEEMGKPLAGGREEAEKCAWGCEYYADNAERFLQPEPVATEWRRSYVTFPPLGVVLAIMPWNYPFWQVFRFSAPALMAGNTVLLKHASNVPGCALAIEGLLRDAGFPPGVFATLLVGSGRIAGIIEHPLVRAITLTGSTAAGRAVAAKAGEMLKKTVLELGGSDPYLVLEDADLKSAADICAAGRLTNSGQSCIAAKRLIVVEKHLEKFESLLVERMTTAKTGDPLDEGTDMGPLARLDLRDELHRQVRESIAGGAKCLLGGEIPAGKGAFYPPTVLSGVRRGMPAHDEELFGPVAAIVPVKDDDEAIRTANDSAYGLGSAVLTRDIDRGERVAVSEIEAGCCFVNAQVRSDPRLPFGGVKDSGYGRELSRHGIREFVNIKTIVVGPVPSTT